MPWPPEGVNVAVGFAVLLNWAEELDWPVTDQAPVPTPGVLAASTAEPGRQMDWSGPAFEAVGTALEVIVTCEVVGVQGLCETVHWNT